MTDDVFSPVIRHPPSVIRETAPMEEEPLYGGVANFGSVSRIGFRTRPATLSAHADGSSSSGVDAAM